MKQALLLLLVWLSFSCKSEVNKNSSYVPTSSGNINHVTVVMPQKDWNSALGDQVRDGLQAIYEGLPLDEPQFSLVYMNPKAFTGFARQNRNIVWLEKIHWKDFV